MLEAARLIRRYLRGVSFEDFWEDSEKRDAVCLRLAVIGESANKIEAATAAALTAVPFPSLRGLRNRIAHDYGAIDFRIVWEITQKDIEPLIAALEAHFKAKGKTGG
jgi:uncharacterized protein with HEPN domain